MLGASSITAEKLRLVGKRGSIRIKNRILLQGFSVGAGRVRVGYADNLIEQEAV